MSVVGVDFGGTRIKAGVVNNGRVDDLRIFPSPADRSLGGILDELESLFREMIAGAETPVSALVWALPCVVAPDGKTISKTYGKYDDCAHLPLVEWAQKRLRLPLILENDARAAAIGEWRHGAGRGVENMVAITLGTGIGSAVIADGRALYGADGFAGILGGFRQIPGGKRPSSFAPPGSLEAEVASWALPEIAKESPLFGTSELSHLARIDYLAVFFLAETGDPLALILRDRAIECWAWLITEMTQLYDPEITVLGGGIMAGADAILPPLRVALGAGIRLEPAALGDAAALAACEEIAQKRPS